MRGKIPLALSLILPMSAAAAESGYIAESIKIGIHETSSLKSTILELVPSGTELEIIERDDEGHARVKIADGVEGWVDARYLRTGIPAQRRVQELEEELLQTATELANARNQVSELEFQLDKTAAEAAALRTGAGQLGAGTGNGGLTSETLREMQSLAEENQKLKQRVAELEAVQAMVIERSPEPQESPTADSNASSEHENSGGFSRYLAFLNWPVWKKLLLLFGMLLVFAIGGFLVDWDVRRRHGGFRV